MQVLYVTANLVNSLNTLLYVTMYAYYTKTLLGNNKATKSTCTAIPRLKFNIFHCYVQGWLISNNVKK